MSFSGMNFIIPEFNRELGELTNHPSYEAERKKEDRYSKKWGEYSVSEALIKRKNTKKTDVLIEESTRLFGKRHAYVQSLNGLDIDNAIKIGESVGLIPKDEKMSDYEKLVVKVFDVKGVNRPPPLEVQRGTRFLIEEEDVKADVFVTRIEKWIRNYKEKDKIVFVENGGRGYGSVYRSPRRGFIIAFVEHDFFNPKILEPSVKETGLITHGEPEHYLAYTTYLPR